MSHLSDGRGHDEFDLRGAERRVFDKVHGKVEARLGVDARVFIADVEADTAIGEFFCQMQDV